MAVTKELSLLAWAQLRHNCSQDISIKVCAWLAPPALSPQAIYVFRNLRYDLTLAFYIPIALDGAEDDKRRNTDIIDQGSNSDSEDSDSACKKF